MNDAHDTNIEGNELHKIWQIHADSTLRSKQQQQHKYTSIMMQFDAATSSGDDNYSTFTACCGTAVPTAAGQHVKWTCYDMSRWYMY